MNVLAAYSRQRFLCEPPLRGRSISPKRMGGLVMADIVGDRKIGKQRQLLENAGDARRVCRRRVGKVIGRPSSVMTPESG